MTRYLVLEAGEDRSERAVFLRDRFSWLALVLPFVWLAQHRLYLAAAIAVVVLIGLAVLGQVDGFGIAAAALALLFGIAIALEGPRLVAARHRRRGLHEAAVVQAGDRHEAELIYYGSRATLAERLAKPDMPLAPPATIRSRSDLPHTGWRSARSLLDAGPR